MFSDSVELKIAFRAGQTKSPHLVIYIYLPIRSRHAGHTGCMYYVRVKLIFRRIAQALSRETRVEYKAPIDLNVNV